MKYLLALSSFLLLMSACSNKYQYFTQDLYDEYQWSDAELQKIQFYVSEDIVLFRRLAGENSKITRGKIRVVDGSEVEEVIISKGTPGVFVQSPKTNRFAISFDSDQIDFLMFGPNKKARGKYVMLAKEWDRRRGKVTYGGTTYETTSESAYAALMVDIKRAKKIKYKSKKVGGARVN